MMKEENHSSHRLNKQLLSTYMALDNWHTFRLRLFIEGIFAGILGGLAISLFRFLLGRMETLRIYLYDTFLRPSLAEGHFLPLAGWIAAIFLVAFLMFLMCRYAPGASGSGIPQVKGIVLGLNRMRWIRILWVKIISGAIGIGCGLSLGREGPSIQIGAAAAQGLSRLLGRTKMEERYLITSGASAGLAAAFNAPLAGMMFALEELHRNFSGAVLLPTMTSAITATIVTRLFFGNGTSFSFTHLLPMPVEHLGLVALIAISAGFFGILFNYGLLHTDRFYRLPVFKNQYLKILFSLLVSAFLGFSLPQILGGGNSLVNQLADAHYPLLFLLLLLAGKYIFTLISYGTGVPGGFFLPLLVVGALLGASEASIFVSFGIMEEAYTSNAIIIGMVSLFAASVRSPITGTLLILEMTGDFGHLMALALGSALAYITAELLKGAPIYDALLQKSLKKKSDDSCEQERNIIEVPIGSGSPLEGKKIADIPHFSNTVLIDLKRNGESMIPDPDIRLQAEDFLYFLTTGAMAEKLKNLGETEVPRNHVRRKFF